MLILDFIAVKILLFLLLTFLKTIARFFTKILVFREISFVAFIEYLMWENTLSYIIDFLKKIVFLHHRPWKLGYIFIVKHVKLLIYIFIFKSERINEINLGIADLKSLFQMIENLGAQLKSFIASPHIVRNDGMNRLKMQFVFLLNAKYVHVINVTRKALQNQRLLLA